MDQSDIAMTIGAETIPNLDEIDMANFFKMTPSNPEQSEDMKTVN
jgi:hypothetical protein